MSEQPRSRRDEFPCRVYLAPVDEEEAVRSQRRGMTEAEWLMCDDAHPMLAYLRNSNRVGRGIADMCSGLLTARKGRLLGAACCRRIWHLLIDARSRNCVEVAELFADGRITSEQLYPAYCDAPCCEEVAGVAAASDGTVDGSKGAWLQGLGGAAEAAIEAVAVDFAAEIVMHWALPAVKAVDIPAQTADFVRDIFGNPFRPVTLSREWRTSVVVAIAQQMYESRDFAAMPILADSLQDAGCDDELLLGHCRNAKLHVRGCWVVDLVLGRE